MQCTQGHTERVGREENRPSNSQLLRGSLSSLCYNPLCSATHEKANAWVSANFLLLLSSPILNSCLGTDWFLLAWSCWEKMNYSLLCQNCPHHPQFHSFFYWVPIFCQVLCLVPWQRQSKANESLDHNTARGKLNCTVTKQHDTWKDTSDRQGREDFFFKLSWLFLGDAQWKRCRA